MQFKFSFYRRWALIATLGAALAACSGLDPAWVKKYDYFAAKPMQNKTELMQTQKPDNRAQQGAAHSQKILEQMSTYDAPVTEPMPRGEGGLISNFSLPAGPRPDNGRILGQPPAMAAPAMAPIYYGQTQTQTPPVPVTTKNPTPIDAEQGQADIVPITVPNSAPVADVAPAPAPVLADNPPPPNNIDPLLSLKQALENPQTPEEMAINPVQPPPSAAPDKKPVAPIDPKAKQNVEINFNNTSLRSVIEFVFGQYIKQPYSIASDFQDKEVNWVLQGEFTVAETKRLFDVFLDLQNVNIGWQGGFYSIANKTSGGRLSGTGGEMGVNTGIWRLRSLDALEATQIIRPFVSSPENIMALDRTNILIVHASAAELRQIDNFLRNVDVSNFQNKRIIVYAPQFISAEGLVTLLQALPQQLGLNNAEGKKQIEAAVISGTKRVAIVTDSPESREAVLQYLQQVDKPGRKQRQVFYYGLRSQTVDDVRTTLTGLLPGLIPDAADITVVANAPTNSLVIGATADQYYEIKKIIDRLDYRVPSVMIDATIVEVQLNNNLAYGVEWFLGGRAGKARGDITIDLPNASAITSPAARIGVVSLSNNTFATLDLLAGETDLRVLSRPRVIVKNKATATIKSTDQVRIVKSVLTTTAQQGGNNLPQREFEDKEVGVSLQVTPRIADDGTISMAVKIQDSRQGATDSSSGEPQPTFNIREVTTELVTKNGETLMIGGLIRNSNNRVKSKVPFLGDLPIFGQAFANTNDNDQRTELIIFMTPYLVVDEISARLVSESLGGLAQINPEISRAATTPDLNLTTPDAEKPKITGEGKPLAADIVLPEAKLSPAPKALPFVPPPPPPTLLDDPESEADPVEPTADIPPSLAPDLPSPQPDMANPGLKPLSKPLLQ